jgi:hypothetical protein
MATPVTDEMGSTGIPEAIMTGDDSTSVVLSPAPLETKTEQTDE